METLQIYYMPTGMIGKFGCLHPLYDCIIQSVDRKRKVTDDLLVFDADIGAVFDPT